MHNDIGTDAVALAGGHGVAVCAPAVPLHTLGLAEFTGNHSHFIRDHKSGIEADTELTDDGEVFISGLLPVHLTLELIGTAPGDHAEVILRLSHRHADAVVTDGDGPGCLVYDDVNAEIITVQPDRIIGQREIAELVNRIGRIGDNLTQENLFVCIDRIDHEIKKPFGFCFELFFCHFCLCLAL